MLVLVGALLCLDLPDCASAVPRLFQKQERGGESPPPRA
jgi:hypothetical protein